MWKYSKIFENIRRYPRTSNNIWIIFGNLQEWSIVFGNIQKYLEHMRRNYDQVTQSVLSVLISSYQFLSVVMGLKLRELGRKISRSETRPPGRSGLSFRSHSGYIQAFFRLHASRLHSGCIQADSGCIQVAFRPHSGCTRRPGLFWQRARRSVLQAGCFRLAAIRFRWDSYAQYASIGPGAIVLDPRRLCCRKATAKSSYIFSEIFEEHLGISKNIQEY